MSRLPPDFCAKATDEMELATIKYYFSVLLLRPNLEIRWAVEVEAEDADAALLYVCLSNEWLESGCVGSVLQISKLHYETLCADLEIDGVLV